MKTKFIITKLQEMGYDFRCIKRNLKKTRRFKRFFTMNHSSVILSKVTSVNSHGNKKKLAKKKSAKTWYKKLPVKLPVKKKRKIRRKLISNRLRNYLRKLNRKKKKFRIRAKPRKLQEPFFRSYLKNPKIRLFTFNIYLTYKAHIGNPRRIRHSLQMITYIFGYRKNLALLNIMSTTINLRKSIAAIYKETENRGTLLIFNPYKESFVIKNNSIFYCIADWIPGIVSNFKRVFKELRYNKLLRREYNGISLDNTQYINTYNALVNFNMGHRKLLFKKHFTCKMPSLSLCFYKSDLCYRELKNAGVPSTILLDTDSYNIDHVTYPLIGNQKSPTLIRLFVNLFVSSVNTACLTEFNALLQIRRLVKKKIIKWKNNLFKKKNLFKKPQKYNHWSTSRNQRSTSRNQWSKNPSFNEPAVSNKGINTFNKGINNTLIKFKKHHNGNDNYIYKKNK